MSRLILKKWRRDIPAVIGVLIVVAVVGIAMLAPQIVPYPGDLYEAHPLNRLQSPSREHWFGTDSLGRDVFSRVLLGARTALIASSAVVGIAMIVGVSLGLIAGYFDGWISQAIMSVTDVFLAVPQLLLALAIAAVLGGGLSTIIFALSVSYWPYFTRIVWTDTRRLRKSMFVDALQGIGASSTRIMLAHILPNAMSTIVVRATIGLGLTILFGAALAFLGVGVAPPAPDWGLAIAESRAHLPQAWWFATFPGLAILLTVLGFSLVGDGLRDILDPKLRRSR